MGSSGLVLGVLGGFLFAFVIFVPISPYLSNPTIDNAIETAKTWTNGCVNISDGNELCFRPGIHAENLTLFAQVSFNKKVLYTRTFQPNIKNPTICLKEDDLIGLPSFSGYRYLMEDILKQEGDFLSACLELRDTVITTKSGQACGTLVMNLICLKLPAWNSTRCVYKGSVDLGCSTIRYQDFLRS